MRYDVKLISARPRAVTHALLLGARQSSLQPEPSSLLEFHTGATCRWIRFRRSCPISHGVGIVGALPLTPLQRQEIVSAAQTFVQRAFAAPRSVARLPPYQPRAPARTRPHALTELPPLDMLSSSSGAVPRPDRCQVHLLLHHALFGACAILVVTPLASQPRANALVEKTWATYRGAKTSGAGPGGGAPECSRPLRCASGFHRVQRVLVRLGCGPSGFDWQYRGDALRSLQCQVQPPVVCAANNAQMDPNPPLSRQRDTTDRPSRTFYEKLLNIKDDRLYTQAARIEADRRQKAMRSFMQELDLEWDGRVPGRRTRQAGTATARPG